MTPYLGCEAARPLLESFMDGELPTATQVAVQAHVRVCSTCALHLQDLSLIGWSMRAGTPETCPDADDAQALSVIQSGVLTRIRAERDQSLPVRMREMMTDMRLLWPALGATAAVLACLYGSVNVWWLTTQKQPDSMSAMIDTLALNGTNTHPTRVRSGVSMPVFIEESFGVEAVSVDEAIMAVDTVVTMEGRVSKAQLVDDHGPGGLHARDRQALLNAVKELRFSPAARSGRPVAVRTLLLFAHTTITEPWRPFEQPVRSVVRRTPTPEAPVAAAPELPPSPPPQAPEAGGVGSLSVVPSATV